MAKSTTAANHTVDFDEINRAMQRGRVLRAQAFRSMLRDAYRTLTGHSADEKPMTPRRYRDCTSAA